MRAIVRPKISYLIWVITIIIIAIVARLLYLQLHQRELFFSQSQKNFLRIEKILSPRGNIFDRNGILLVTNRPTTDLYWQGSGNRKLTSAQQHIIHTISSIMGTPWISDEQLLTSLTQTERLHKKLLLSADISFDQISKIEEMLMGDPNIKLETNFKRFYPHKECACHILGYLGNLDTQAIGKMGLEQLFHEQLKGNPGSIVRTINSLGKNLGVVEIKKPFAGDDIQVTIDLGLQQLAETIFPQELAGTMIIMDPEDGSLLALLSRPHFDPTMFLDPLSHESWHALQEKQPLLNRAFNATYPPGSIFKLISVSAALEHHVIAPDAIIDCKGFIKFGNRKCYCARQHGHGELSICDAVAYSCNILFYEIGKRIDIDLLASYAHQFGLGEKTNILFQEKTGLIPSRAWKKMVKKERWWPGETLSAAIGQSYLLVTPIQIARMISSIFTGYLVTPRIALHEPVVKKPLDIQHDTRAFLKRSMKAVVKTGTGQQVNTVKDIIIYAKTSTAQTSALYKRDLGKKYLEHGWFVGHITYKQQKPFTVVILVENAGTSRVATQIAKDFLIAYKQMVDTVAG